MMEQTLIDSTVKSQIFNILLRCDLKQDFLDRVEISPINNSFQNKHNVFKISFGEHDKPLVLKLEHQFFDANLLNESMILAFLSNTTMSVPRCIRTGTCDVYKIGDRFPQYLLMEFVEGIPLNWVYYGASEDERRNYLRQVIMLIHDLSHSCKVDISHGDLLVGSMGDEITRSDNGVYCNNIKPFNNESVGSVHQCGGYVFSAHRLLAGEISRSK